MENRALRAGLALLTTFAIAAGATLVMTGSASASAASCTFFGSGLRGPIRNGQFCSGVTGSGTSINGVNTGNFGSTVPIVNGVCNPSQRLDVYDRWGRWITSRQGGQRSGCSWGTWNSVPGIPVNWSFPQASNGYVMVSLQDSGRTVAALRYNLGS